MASTPRLNRVIDSLIHKKPVLSTNCVPNGSFAELAAIGRSRYDMVILEMEHRGFDFSMLRQSMQALLNRQRIQAQATLQASPTPLVRIPVYGRELAYNQWVVKQTLDSGAYGLVIPHLESPEAALAAANAARFPRPGYDGGGTRGWSDSAAEYWGLSSDAFYEKADVWPLNPDGEILLIGIIESVEGVKQLPAILEQSKGIGLIWAGAGDLSTSMGFNNQTSHPEVERAVLQIRDTCKKFGVACAASTSATVSAEQRIEQGFDAVLFAHARMFDTVNQLASSTPIS
jgi:4-hydroxy-2-oxoheptanedioate aldolase